MHQAQQIPNMSVLAKRWVHPTEPQPSPWHSARSGGGNPRRREKRSKLQSEQARARRDLWNHSFSPPDWNLASSWTIDFKGHLYQSHLVMISHSDSRKSHFEWLICSDSRFCRMAIQPPDRVVPNLATLAWFVIRSDMHAISYFIHPNNLPFTRKSAGFGAPACRRSDFEWLANRIDMWNDFHRRMLPNSPGHVSLPYESISSFVAAQILCLWWWNCFPDMHRGSKKHSFTANRPNASLSWMCHENWMLCLCSDLENLPLITIPIPPSVFLILWTAAVSPDGPNLRGSVSVVSRKWKICRQAENPRP